MINNKTLPTAVITATLALSACTSTAQLTGDLIALQHCTIQQSIPGAKATGAFLTINKKNKAPLALVAAKTPTITDHVEIHEMVMGNGTMTMQQITAYPLAEGNNAFKKGGYHIMLMGLKKTLAIGEKHPLTLQFNDGSQQTCQATVKSVEALTPKTMSMKKKHMPHSHGDGKVHTH